jgi:hypothetical protein
MLSSSSLFHVCRCIVFFWGCAGLLLFVLLFSSTTLFQINFTACMFCAPLFSVPLLVSWWLFRAALPIIVVRLFRAALPIIVVLG